MGYCAKFEKEVGLLDCLACLNQQASVKVMADVGIITQKGE